MKKKANIYDADDVERSKRLNFTPEERAARAEHKAEVLGTKLEKAKKKVPKKKKLRLQKELDPEKSKLKHTLRFEEVEKKRGQEALPKKAGRRMVQSASATVHSKIHQVEEENVGTKAAHRTELASEGAAALASHEIRKYRQNAPYKRVEKLEAQVNRANVSAAYRAAVRDNPELQENTVKRLIQKQRIKHQYAKEFRKAKQAEKQGSAFVQKAKDMFGSIGQTVATAVQEHKGGLVMAGAIAMLIIMVFSSLSSCSVMMDGAMSAVLGTSYTSEDPDIIQTEANYTALETALQNELANIERTHPGYDEYRYDVDSIGHGMGIEAAAYATVLSQFIQAAVTLWYFKKKSPNVKIGRIRIDGTLLPQVLSVGVSALLMQILTLVQQTVIYRVASNYGGETSQLLLGAALRFWNFSFVPLWGISQGFQPAAGTNYGAKDYDRVKKLTKVFIIAATLLSLVFYIPVELFPEKILSMFLTTPGIAASGATNFRIMFSTYILQGSFLIAVTLFQSLGKANKATWLVLFRQIILFIPLCVILPMIGGMGIRGVWLAIALTDAILVVITISMMLYEFGKMPATSSVKR